jgi:hypothetical protein
MAGKYTPLEYYLQDIPSNQAEVTLSFEQIERILNDKLPPSACNRLQWWENERNGSHVEAHAWMDAGWMVESFDQRRCIVRFRRA